MGTARLIDRVATALRAATDGMLLAANDAGAASWLPGVAVVTDRHRGVGGLAGVAAALERGRDVIVVAWDMPFVRPQLLTALAREAHGRDVDVVLPASASPYGMEPFCAFYSARVAGELERFLAEGGGPARDFIRARSRVYLMPLDEVSRHGDPDRMFFSVNTRADLSRAQAMAQAAE